MCRRCFDKLSQGTLPPVSLANDMWIGYAPARIYTEKATVMELICASPCVTTLVCMSMEARHRYEATAFDEIAHMARHRFGARGNALTFPLPWEDLLVALQDEVAERAHSLALPRSGVLVALQDEVAERAHSLALPRSGDELASLVRIILKTNKEGKTTEQEVKSLIHQANVRREAPWMKLAGPQRI